MCISANISISEVFNNLPGSAPIQILQMTIISHFLIRLEKVRIQTKNIQVIPPKVRQHTRDICWNWEMILLQNLKIK